MDGAGGGDTPVNRAAVIQHHHDAVAVVSPEPSITHVAGNIAGSFTTTPVGVILHGSRSGQPYTVEQEFQATLNYVNSGAAGLGWNITIADGKVCEHMAPRYWGWNARNASKIHLACEFAQAHLGDEITDGQIDAFCWWFLNVAREAWPGLPMAFPNHSELPEGIADGKSDVEPRGENSVRDRIIARLA